MRRLARGREVELCDWTSQMFDRLGLVTSRVGVADGANLAHENIDGLRDLRVGLNIGTIRGVEAHLGLASRSALEGVLETVSGAYSSKIGSRPRRIGLEQAIDHGITSLGAEVPSRPMLDGLAALTGLRLDLAPTGSRYMRSPHSPDSP